MWETIILLRLVMVSARLATPSSSYAKISSMLKTRGQLKPKTKGGSTSGSHYSTYVMPFMLPLCPPCSPNDCLCSLIAPSKATLLFFLDGNGNL